MTNNVWYNYVLNINSSNPLRISNAIIALDVYLNPSVRFNITVNKKACSTPSYYVSTTFAGAGQSRIIFDCSNTITHNGIYNVSILPTGQNTGAVSAWSEITYSSDGSGDLHVSGTEYEVGDMATVFTQLLDLNKLPINNGSCFLDIFYPLINGSHPRMIHDAPMIPAGGDDGFYYYDLSSPPQLGVYMLSARCAYSYNWVWFFGADELARKPANYTILGTWSGDTVSLNSPSDLTFYKCDVASLGAGCLVNFTFNMSSLSGIAYNITSMNLYYSGQIKGSLSNPWNLYLSYWNGTRFVRLNNSLIMTHQSDAPLGTDQYVTNILPLGALINNESVIILLNLTGGTGTGTTLWNNWLSTAVLLSTGTVQEVRGGGELHVRLPHNVSCGNVSVNVSCPQDIINVSCNSSCYYNATINFTGNFSCPHINYSEINDSCAGFFQRNGGETMWTYLIIIMFALAIAEWSKSHVLRFGVILLCALFTFEYWGEAWSFAFGIVTLMYSLYVVIHLGDAKTGIGQGWS
jgi:hypothetical protein